MTLELDALAKSAVAGDARALSSLVQALEAPVYRLCLRLLGDVRDAEDAAQDVLVKVVTSLSRFEGRSALMTWVHQIAVRHVLAMKKSRAEERSVDEDGFAELLSQGLAFSATQPPPSPEERALMNEVRLTCTQGMLLTLGREERLALVLVDLLGFDGAEAALIVETSHDAFRQRLARARAPRRVSAATGASARAALGVPRAGMRRGEPGCEVFVCAPAACETGDGAFSRPREALTALAGRREGRADRAQGRARHRERVSPRRALRGARITPRAHAGRAPHRALPLPSRGRGSGRGVTVVPAPASLPARAQLSAEEFPPRRPLHQTR